VLRKEVVAPRSLSQAVISRFSLFDENMNITGELKAQPNVSFGHALLSTAHHLGSVTLLWAALTVREV